MTKLQNWIKEQRNYLRTKRLNSDFRANLNAWSRMHIYKNGLNERITKYIQESPGVPVDIQGYIYRKENMGITNNTKYKRPTSWTLNPGFAATWSESLGSAVILRMKLSDPVAKMYIGNTSLLLNQDRDHLSLLPNQSEIIVEPCQLMISSVRNIPSPRHLLYFYKTESGKKLDPYKLSIRNKIRKNSINQPILMVDVQTV